MDATAKKLIQLLDGGDHNLRVAAMRVISELDIRNKTVVHSLGRALREDSDTIKILALRGLMKHGAADVVDMVIPLILDPGEVRDHALAVVVAIGERSIRSLKALYPNADFHGRRAIITALSRIGSIKALDFLLENLLVEPFELQKHLSQCLCAAIDALPPRSQRPLFELVKKYLSSPRVKNDLQAQVVCLILLGHFRAERDIAAARKILRNFAGPKNQPEVRRYAMISLSRSIMEAPVEAELLQLLRRSLCDDDWHNVAQHALSAFQRLDMSRLKSAKLVGLLKESPHFSVHIHVFERLKNENRPEVAKAILPFLRDSRYRVRDAAEQALRAMPSAMGDLFAVLSDAVDSDLSQRLHAIVRDYPQDVKRKYLDRAIKRFMTLHERNDRRSQFFLDLVRSIDPEPLRRKIYQKVESLKRGRSSDRWLKISRYLQVLWDHHLITPEGRYAFAIALIRQSTKDISPHARRANLGLTVMKSLIYDDTPGLVANLTKDRNLAPDDLFYIGFHFMEEGEEYRPFARALLEYLTKKSPNSKVGKDATEKLGLHEEPEPSTTRGRRGAKAAAARAKAKAAAKAKEPAKKAGKETSKKDSKKTSEKKTSPTAAKKKTSKKTARKPSKAAKKAKSTKTSSSKKASGKKAKSTKQSNSKKASGKKAKPGKKAPKKSSKKASKSKKSAKRSSKKPAAASRGSKKQSAKKSSKKKRRR